MLRGIYSMVMAPASDGAGGGGAPPPAPPADGAGAGGSLLTQGGGGNPPPAAGGAQPPVGGGVPPVAGGAPPAALTPPTPFNLPDNWKDTLPDDIKGDPALKPISDFHGLVKSYLSGQKMIGADKIAIPGKHATEEDWRNLFQRLGQPANIQDYKLELPNDAGFDETFVNQLREEAFKLNILPQQLNKLLGWYSDANKTAVEKMNTEYKSKVAEGVSGLQKEWGQAFKDKLELAKRGAKYFAEKNGIPNINTWLDGTGMGDDPTMIKMLAFLGGFLKEDSIHGSEFSPHAQTPNQIDQEIKSIQGDPKHPYYDKSHPNHKVAVEHMAKLWEQLHPPQQRMA